MKQEDFNKKAREITDGMEDEEEELKQTVIERIKQLPEELGLCIG